MDAFESYQKIMEDLRQNKEWLKYGREKGLEWVEIDNYDGTGVLYGTLHKLIFGLKLLKVQRSSEEPDWEKLKKIKKENFVVSTIIEPQHVEDKENYKRKGYKLSNFPYLATKTVVIDLRKSQNILWNQLSENAKRLIKRNKDVVIKEVEVEVFYKTWKENSKIWVLKLSELKLMKKVLKKKVKFLMSFENNSPQSGILLVETKDTANYFHSFTTDAGRKTGAHFKLVWETLLTEKKRGVSFFDFEGIYDDRWPQKRWLGFSEFKKKFGGKVVSFPGCFQKWL